MSNKLQLLGNAKANGAKARSSGGDKPPLCRKQRCHTALPSQPTLMLRVGAEKSQTGLHFARLHEPCQQKQDGDGHPDLKSLEVVNN